MIADRSSEIKLAIIICIIIIMVIVWVHQKCLYAFGGIVQYSLLQLLWMARVKLRLNLISLLHVAEPIWICGTLYGKVFNEGATLCTQCS